MLTSTLGNILVTGGTGSIGSNLVKRLVADGCRVRVFDNNAQAAGRRLQSCIDEVEVVEGDIRDYADVLSATEGIDTVFHLASINGTQNFYTRPDEVLGVGVKGALNTLDAAIQCKVRRYIVASSSEVYQEPTRIPTPEEERLLIPDVKNPRFSYSGAKIISELLALHYTSRSPVETIICRPHNFYGPDMGLGHVIPQFILRMKELSKDFSIREIDFPIEGTGKETRAFCYILDGIEGLLLCAMYGRNREIYHLGTQEEVSMAEVATMLADYLGIAVKLRGSPSPAGSTPRRCPNIAKVTQLGYKPNWPLAAGLKETVEWYLKAHGAEVRPT